MLHLEAAVCACRKLDDLFAAGGALGLGVSLYFIHIYVTPLKRFIQVVSLYHSACFISY
jgi:uncharacterized integral membrane protein